MVYLSADIDNIEYGLWCERCLNPSGFKVPVVELSHDGVAVCGVMESCVDCDERDGEFSGELDCR